MKSEFLSMDYYGFTKEWRKSGGLIELKINRKTKKKYKQFVLRYFQFDLHFPLCCYD